MILELVNYPGWASLDASQLKQWFKLVSEVYNCPVGRLSYSFIDDPEIIRINSKYLRHNYPTDIITFDYGSELLHQGEVVISLDTVIRNANDLSLKRSDELDRVLVHGLLHLFGFNDNTEEERKGMRAEENKCLLLRPKNLIGK